MVILFSFCPKSNTIKYIDFFTPSENTLSNIDEEFAILNHHKEYFDDNNFKPILSLGTVIKSPEGKYFVCIQPLCDTVRITEINNNFLFVPLKNATPPNETKIVIFDGEKYLKLKPNYKTNSLQFLKFKIKFNVNFIQATEKKFIVISGEDEVEYEWILNLKDNHAQRIANEFGAYVSRVGLDEPEWLRRS